MAAKDYYLILGISRNETPRGVRSAFRDLALRHHPDRAGPAGAPRFREVVEAYRVLSDPRSRREHDASLHEHASPTARREGSRGPAGHRRAFDVVDPFARPESIRPSADALLARVLRNFMGSGMRKGEGAEPILCDVVLSPIEARRGGVLPLRIPIAMSCPNCRGMTQVAGFPCRSCDARGAVASDVIATLQVPPGVRPGTVVEASLDPWGIRNLWLRVRIGVGG